MRAIVEGDLFRSARSSFFFIFLLLLLLSSFFLFLLSPRIVPQNEDFIRKKRCFRGRGRGRGGRGKHEKQRKIAKKRTKPKTNEIKFEKWENSKMFK